MPNFPGRRSTYEKLLFSPDGKKLIVATEQVSAIDLETFALTKLFRATKNVSAMAISSDGVTLAIGSADRLIYIYDFWNDSGRLNTLHGHNKPIQMVAFASDDKHLLSAGESGEVRLWQLGEPAFRSFYEALAPEILTERLRDSQTLIFSHDRFKLLAYDRFGVLHSWELARPDVSHLGPNLLFARAQFAIGSQILAWTPGGTDSSIFLEEPGRKERKLGDHGEQIEVLAISADDRYIASGGKMLSFWDVQTGKSIPLVGHTTYLRNLSFVGMRLLSTDLEGKTFQWELPSGEGRLVAEHGEMINGMVGVAVDPKGRWIATAGVRGKVLLHDIATGSKRVLSEGTNPVRGMAVSKDGEMLAFSAQQSELTVFFTQDESKTVVLHSPEAREDLYFPDFSPDARSLVICSDKLGLRLWSDWQSDSTRSRILHSKDESYFPRFSPDGTLIVAPGSQEGVASLWEVGTGQRRDLKGPSSNGKAEFWQAGNRIVVSNMHGVVSLWLDDLPHDWPGLSAWIREQISKHHMRSKFQEN
jgi:WD40 repeat protein